MLALEHVQPPNTATHHYLCYHPSQDLELKFLLTGLCPNDPRFGVWMDTGLHQALHGKGLRGQGWGPGGPWNYQWIEFFDDAHRAGRVLTAVDVEDFLAELLNVISNPSIPVERMNWRYRP